MATDTKIQWCHHTFNPWRGCTKVSAGCANCYAETQAKRNPGVLGIWGDAGTRVVASDAMWPEPLKWDRAAAAAGERRRVFCASMADVFEDRGGHHVHDSQGNVLWNTNEHFVTHSGRTTPGLSRGERTATLDDVRDKLRWLMFETPNLDWLLLTKRPQFAAKWINDHLFPQNVWLGVSVENQDAADERIPALLKIPAKVRFLSVEPLLGPVELWSLRCGSEFDSEGAPYYNALRGASWWGGTGEHGCHGPAIDWVIVGGESGPKARPCDLAWIRSIVEQCKDANVPCFVKQVGSSPALGTISIDGPDSHRCTYEVTDPKGGDPDEWPSDLRVRKFPGAGNPAGRPYGDDHV